MNQKVHPEFIAAQIPENAHQPPSDASPVQSINYMEYADSILSAAFSVHDHSFMTAP